MADVGFRELNTALTTGARLAREALQLAHLRGRIDALIQSTRNQQEMHELRMAQGKLDMELKRIQAELAQLKWSQAQRRELMQQINSIYKLGQAEVRNKWLRDNDASRNRVEILRILNDIQNPLNTADRRQLEETRSRLEAMNRWLAEHIGARPLETRVIHDQISRQVDSPANKWHDDPVVYRYVEIWNDAIRDANLQAQLRGKPPEQQREILQEHGRRLIDSVIHDLEKKWRGPQDETVRARLEEEYLRLLQDVDYPAEVMEAVRHIYSRFGLEIPGPEESGAGGVAPGAGAPSEPAARAPAEMPAPAVQIGTVEGKPFYVPDYSVIGGTAEFDSGNKYVLPSRNAPEGMKKAMYFGFNKRPHEVDIRTVTPLEQMARAYKEMEALIGRPQAPTAPGGAPGQQPPAAAEPDPSNLVRQGLDAALQDPHVATTVRAQVRALFRPGMADIAKYEDWLDAQANRISQATGGIGPEQVKPILHDALVRHGLLPEKIPGPAAASPAPEAAGAAPTITPPSDLTPVQPSPLPGETGKAKQRAAAAPPPGMSGIVGALQSGGMIPKDLYARP